MSLEMWSSSWENCVWAYSVLFSPFWCWTLTSTNLHTTRYHLHWSLCWWELQPYFVHWSPWTVKFHFHCWNLNLTAFWWYADTAGNMGPRLHCCQAFLCSGGDVDRHHNPLLLPGRWRAPGQCAVCAPSSDGNSGWTEWSAKTNSGTMISSRVLPSVLVDLKKMETW